MSGKGEMGNERGGEPGKREGVDHFPRPISHFPLFSHLPFPTALRDHSLRFLLSIALAQFVLDLLLHLFNFLDRA